MTGLTFMALGVLLACAVWGACAIYDWVPEGRVIALVFRRRPRSNVLPFERERKVS